MASNRIRNAAPLYGVAGSSPVPSASIDTIAASALMISTCGDTFDWHS